MYYVVLMEKLTGTPPTRIAATCHVAHRVSGSECKPLEPSMELGHAPTALACWDSVPVRPVIRWAGGKRKLLPRLVQRAQGITGRYYEPFCGSACLFFALRPRHAVIGDANGELTNAYMVLRRTPREFLTSLHSLPVNSVQYYRIRELDPKGLPRLARAVRFVYLMQNCYGGMYRTDRDGRFNVPVSKNPTPLPNAVRSLQCSLALRGALIRHGDFEKCLVDAEAGDFVYLDPPYVSGARPRSGEYGNGSFSAADLPRLVACLRKLDDRGVTFLLSYHAVASFSGLLDPRWHVTRVRTRRTIAKEARHRRAAYELLVTNRASKEH
jgi:DNA adenine methylase